MQDRALRHRRLIWVAAALLCMTVPSSCFSTAPKPWRPEIPRTWDETALATLELPNCATGKPAKHISAEQYYALPTRTIYKTYPVYVDGREPPGYLEQLAGKEPEIAFDASSLITKNDWIVAGELMFRWPNFIRPYDPKSPFFLAQKFSRFGGRTTPEGIDPYTVYVVREKGKVEIGSLACAMCHTRVMSDGSVILGAQGNSPFDHAFATTILKFPPPVIEGVVRELYAMPEIEGLQPALPDGLGNEELARLHEAIPAGVLSRQGTSPYSPVQIPDLIGVQTRPYLDRSGLVRHRGIGDIMRYVALNQGMDMLSKWNDFQPRPYEPPADGQLPDESDERYGEEQLYALALFVYSLTPPLNPNRMDALAHHGEEIFEEENCARCHDGANYGGNQLVPAPGFTVPDVLRDTERIRRKGVGTDPTYTTITRRGTGLYKIPSLRGVWYRGPFHHNGMVATLEDWFDPARHEDSYMPTGWNPDGKPKAVVGHKFGLDLSAKERRALIAFLRTL